jgi:hypothetical protein
MTTQEREELAKMQHHVMEAFGQWVTGVGRKNGKLVVYVVPGAKEKIPSVFRGVPVEVSED